MISPINWFNLGDQFAIAYLCLSDVEPSILSTPNIFLISQATESYLKGCLMLKFPDKDPVRYGHNQFKIFNELKEDDEFLPSINIPQRVYDSFDISHHQPRVASVEDKEVVEKYYSLLLAFKYGYELKYFGVGLKTVDSKSYGYKMNPLDPLYAEFISGIRRYSGMDIWNHNAWVMLKRSDLYQTLSEEKKKFVNSIKAD